MAKYEVSVRVVKLFKDPYIIYASSPEEAEKKASELVIKWDDIEEAQGFDAVEVD